MPLLDHFHPPLHPQRHWESFHANWAGALADLLNEQLLPEGYFAEEQTHAGSRVEIDVATFERAAPPVPSRRDGATATLPPQVWSPPAPAMEMPGVRPDRFEVLVFQSEGGATLVAAIELISPGNKDRPEHRRAFAAKCVNYLAQGIGLLILDIVTSRQGNLHNEFVQLLGNEDRFLLPAEAHLYAVAYRPVRRDEGERIAVWPARLAVGQPLPVLPLAVGTGLCVPLDLESTYTHACRRRRLV
jgi:hypothetical protein